MEEEDRVFTTPGTFPRRSCGCREKWTSANGFEDQLHRPHSLVDQRDVVRREEDVLVDNSDESSVDNDGLGREDGTVRDDSVSNAACEVDSFERGVGDVELIDEREELGFSGDRLGHVETVRPDGLVKRLPVQVNATTGAFGEGVVAVEARGAVEGVRLVGDVEQREASELDARVVGRARPDVLGKQSPLVRLRDAGLEPTKGRG